MLYITLGALGSLIINLFNINSVKRIPFLKMLIWLAGTSLLVYSVVMVAVSADKLALPLWTLWAGWLLMAISMLLLAYSLFINIPFARTYLGGGSEEKLVTGGLYALVRHPWLPSFSLLLISLIPVSQSRLSLVAAPVWILLNVILVFIQDKVIFPRVFNGYEQYRQQTPMLIPSRKSITAFVGQYRR